MKSSRGLVLVRTLKSGLLVLVSGVLLSCGVLWFTDIDIPLGVITIGVAVAVNLWFIMEEIEDKLRTKILLGGRNSGSIGRN